MEAKWNKILLWLGVGRGKVRALGGIESGGRLFSIRGVGLCEPVKEARVAADSDPATVRLIGLKRHCLIIAALWLLLLVVAVIGLGPALRQHWLAAVSLLMFALVSLTFGADALRSRREIRTLAKVSARNGKRCRTSAEDSPFMICRFLPNGEITYVNEAYCGYFEQTLDELVGQSFLSLILKTDREKVMADISALTVDSPIQSHEYRVITPDGKICWQLWTNRAMFDSCGEVVAYQSVGEDITERRETEEALKKEKNFSNTLVQASPAFIVVIGADGRIIAMSNSMLEALGYSEDEVIGIDYLETFVPKEDHELVSEVFNELIEKHIGRLNENRVLTKDGRKLLVEWQGSPILGEDEQFEYFFGVGTDITERKQAEEDRKRLNDQLRQAQKMEAVGLLAGGIAHDFNNILAAIMGNAELLTLTLPKNSRDAQFADEIIHSAHRAANITKQLLAYARVGTKQVVPVDIHKVVKDTANMLTHSIDRRIKIRLDLRAVSHTIVGDPTQLSSALLNMGVNARDAMPQGGELIFVTKDVLVEKNGPKRSLDLQPGQYIEISVTDTGIGMDQQTQEKIFDPFFTTKEVDQGTGLGLASVLGYVKDLKGSIHVYSEPEMGTTFRIMFPIVEVTSEDRLKASGTETPENGSGHILIIDDEESIRRFASIALENMGYTTSSCCDGAQAVDFLKEHYREIDLIILDLVMPKMNGPDVFREIRKLQPGAKILISSGFSHSETMQRLLDEGAKGTLNKPFQLDELSRTVARYISDDPEKNASPQISSLEQAK